MKIFAFLLLLIPLTATSQLDESYQKYNKAMAKGKFNKAQKILIKIAKSENNELLNYLTRGHFFGNTGKIDSATYYLDLAIDHFKYANISFQDKSFFQKKDSLYSMAIDVCDIIIQDAPTSHNYMLRGIYKKDSGLDAESLTDFRQAIALDSTISLNYYNFALAHKELGNIDSALHYYDLAIETDPLYSSAYLNKGFIYLEQERYEKALEEFSLCIENGAIPKTASYAINNMGYCFYKLEKFDKALFNIRTSLKLNPINSYAYKNLALIHIALLDQESACDAIDKAIELGFVNNYGNEILILKEENCQ